MSDDFQRVKAALSITSVIKTETGLGMKGMFLEQCPFCGGHGCFSIKEDTQGYHCFQCADGHGDVFTFIEKYHHISRGEALVRAAAIAGIDLEQKPARKEREKRESTTEKIYRLVAERLHNAAISEGSPAREWFCANRGHKFGTLLKLRVGWSEANV